MISFTLGFSSCPNDTFMFDALVHNKIEHNYQFRTQIEDIETLNQLVSQGLLDISKISIHGFLLNTERYQLMSSGAALGRGCGPLLLGRKKGNIPVSGRIALPGELTTASLLFKIAVQGDFELVYMPFNEIIPSLVEKKVDYGVIIHESRFTYREFGLNCLLDLGTWWEEESGYPLPLGGIAMSRKVLQEDKVNIDRLLKESIQFAQRNPDSSAAFIQKYAQESSQSVVQQHIQLYVNPFSVELQEEGKEAILALHSKAVNAGCLPEVDLTDSPSLFVS